MENNSNLYKVHEKWFDKKHWGSGKNNNWTSSISFFWKVKFMIKIIRIIWMVNLLRSVSYWNLKIANLEIIRGILMPSDIFKTILSTHLFQLHDFGPLEYYKFISSQFATRITINIVVSSFQCTEYFLTSLSARYISIFSSAEWFAWFSTQ